jgi:2',3'-cyclic-nucleotide 2'-phosphodiesterase (5'-nucleotidase family)
MYGCTDSLPSEQRLMVPATISGLDMISHFIGEDAIDLLEGVTVDHNFYDLDIKDIVIESSNIIWDKEGVYIIFYRFETPYGVVTRQSRIVTVISSTQNQNSAYPLILNAVDLTYYLNDVKPDYIKDVTAFDIVDGYIPLTVDDTLVNYNEVGTYILTYIATNKKGLETRKDIEVTILERDLPLSLVYINDFHGAILKTESNIGLSGIGAYIESLDQTHTLFISGGDLLQGSMLSNYYYGAPIIAALNALNHESFVIGNHEFDWGIEKILAYKDPLNDVVANYNFLGTNIRYTNTLERPENILPYDIIIRDGKKIGVIGAMGFGLESSIATSKINGYTFTDPVEQIKKDAHTLRTSHDVDVVIAVIHGANNTMNLRLAALTGSSQIDAIFNGHTHQTYINPANERSGLAVPIVQAGAYGQNVAQLDFYFEKDEYVRIESKMLNTSNTPEFLNTSADIDAIISPYFLGIQSLIETPILQSGQAYSRNDLTQFMARLMADEVDASVGIHNYGGTRVSLGYLEAITVGKTYEIFPFDNTIKTVYLKGSEIKALVNRFQNSEVYVQSNTTFLDDTYYKVATNDYLFDKETYPFLTGSDSVSTGILIRDIFIDAVTIQEDVYDYFYISQYMPLSLIGKAYLERRSYGSFI